MYIRLYDEKWSDFISGFKNRSHYHLYVMQKLTGLVSFRHGACMMKNAQSLVMLL